MSTTVTSPDQLAEILRRTPRGSLRYDRGPSSPGATSPTSVQSPSTSFHSVIEQVAEEFHEMKVRNLYDVALELSKLSPREVMFNTDGRKEATADPTVTKITPGTTIISDCVPSSSVREKCSSSLPVVSSLIDEELMQLERQRILELALKKLDRETNIRRSLEVIRSSVRTKMQKHMDDLVMEEVAKDEIIEIEARETRKLLLASQQMIQEETRKRMLKNENMLASLKDMERSKTLEKLEEERRRQMQDEQEQQLQQEQLEQEKLRQQQLQQQQLQQQQLQQEQLQQEKLQQEKLQQEKIQQEKIQEEQKQQLQQQEQRRQPEDQRQMPFMGKFEQNPFGSQRSYQRFQELTTMKNEWQRQLEPLITSIVDKAFKFDCQKAVNTPVNAISSISSSHLRDKINKLKSLIQGQPVDIGGDRQISSGIHPLGIPYCKSLLAKKLVSQGAEVVSSKPELAFSMAAVIVALWSSFPDFGQLFLANLFESCPYLVPIHFCREDSSSDEEYNKRMGYRYLESGEIEEQSKFINNMSGLARLYAAITVSCLPRDFEEQEHPHGLGNVWSWLASQMNMQPKNDITATMMLDILDVTGYALVTNYGRMFFKMLALLQENYFQMIQEVTGKGAGGPLSRLDDFLKKAIQSGNIKKKSHMLNPGFL